MAVPVKAYIDPTYAGRFGPVAPALDFSINKLLLPKMSPFAPILFKVPETQRIPYVASRIKEINPTFYPKLPTPPMGRAVVMTFPAIYKEYSAGSTTIVGQIYPPKAP